MTNKTLLNLAPGKNGTTSVFEFLSNHPQIEASNPKEPQSGFQREFPIVTFKTPEKYYKVWEKDNDVYLDGTPGILCSTVRFSQEITKTLKFNKYKLIYILRNHLKYYTSLLYTNGIIEPLLYPEHFLYSDQLDRAEKNLGKENIFVVKLDEIEERQKEIFTFLDIDHHTFKFPHLNSSLDANKFQGRGPYAQQKRTYEGFNWLKEFHARVQPKNGTELFIKCRKLVLKDENWLKEYFEKDKILLKEKWNVEL